MKRIINCLCNTTLYKAICICFFILTPSYFLCYFPQPFSATLLLWGAILILKDLKSNRNLFKQTGCILLVLFCFSYIITIIFYLENEIVSTIHLFCWTVIEFFVFFAIDREENKSFKDLLKELYIINRAATVVCLITGVISLFFFFIKVSLVLPDPEGINGVWFMGVINGRNTGFFNNAISCANAMFIGCVASLFNIFYPQKKKKIAIAAYVITFVVCALCITTTLTRTYMYGLYIIVFIAAFIVAYQLLLKKKKHIIKCLALTVCISLICTGSVVLFSYVGKIGMVELSKVIPQISIGENHGLEDVQDAETPVDTSLERSELDRLPHFFYPRSELWKVALQVIPNSPVFGFTTGNTASASLDYGSTPYFITYEPNGIPTYHNAYFDLATSAGLLGMGLMLIFIILQTIRAIRVVFKKELFDSSPKFICSFSFVIAYLATHIFLTCMFLGVLCLTNSSVCVYFWILLGYASKINDSVLGYKEPLAVDSLLKRISTRKQVSENG